MQQDNYTEVAACIIKQSDNICRGIYDETEEVFNYTNTEVYPKNVVKLAEGFGMMAVKLEAREFHLQQLVENLQENNALLKQEMKMRREFSYIFVILITFVCIYTFGTSYMQSASSGISSTIQPYISRILEIATLLLSFGIVRRIRLPLASFGVTLTGWKKSLKESLLISLLIMAVMTGVKIYLQSRGTGSFGDSLITFEYVDWTYYAYILVAPLQELIGRGILQTSIQRVMSGRYDWLWSIILSALLFGVFHLFMSTTMAIVAMLSGLVWGAMFARHKTLLGCSLSHMLIGIWVCLLGMWQAIAM